jgi:hypothetical protein
MNIKEVLKQSTRQGGGSQAEQDYIDNASVEELKVLWDILWEEVDKEINREIVKYSVDDFILTIDS